MHPVIRAAAAEQDVSGREAPEDVAGSPTPSPSPTPTPTFRELFDAHARFVWRALLALGMDESEVPDASQQVFLVLHRKLAHLAPETSPRTFMYGICLRVASEQRRRGKRRRERAYAELPEVPSGPTQEDRAWQRQSLARLRDALDALDPGQREVFVL